MSNSPHLTHSFVLAPEIIKKQSSSRERERKREGEENRAEGWIEASQVKQTDRRQEL